MLLGLKEEQDLNVKLMVIPKEDAEKEGPRKNRSRMSCQSKLVEETSSGPVSGARKDRSASRGQQREM